MTENPKNAIDVVIEVFPLQSVGDMVTHVVNDVVTEVFRLLKLLA